MELGAERIIQIVPKGFLSCHFHGIFSIFWMKLSDTCNRRGPRGILACAIKCELWYFWSSALSAFLGNHGGRVDLLRLKTAQILCVTSQRDSLWFSSKRPRYRQGFDLLWDIKRGGRHSLCSNAGWTFFHSAERIQLRSSWGRARHCGKGKGDPCSVSPSVGEKWDAVCSKRVIRNITAGLILWNKVNARLWVNLPPGNRNPRVPSLPPAPRWTSIPQATPGVQVHCGVPVGASRCRRSCGLVGRKAGAQET